MKNWRGIAAIVTISLSLAACHEPSGEPNVVIKDPVDGKNFYLTASSKAQINGQCQEIAALGSLQSARQQIKADMAEIRQLIRADDLVSVRDRVQFLSSRVRQNSDLMIALAQDKYVNDDVLQRLRWELGPQSLGIKSQNYWKVANVKIERVYNWQGENSGLHPYLRLEHNSQNVIVKLERSASTLEVCQLQQTVAVHLLVEFRGPQGQVKISHYKLLAKNSGG